MRFGDFLKATVLLCAGCATLLAFVTILGITREDDRIVIYVTAGWWVLATSIGISLGTHSSASAPIARLLAGARSQTTLPELNPGTTLLNRLWGVLLVTLAAAVLSLVEPQVSSVAAGFTIIWALAWRNQERAVLAIEERDGVRFYVDRTSPFSPIQLIRTPGFGGDYLTRPG